MTILGSVIHTGIMRSLILIYTSVKQQIISDMIKQMPLLQLMAVIQLSINCKLKQDLPVS